MDPTAPDPETAVGPAVADAVADAVSPASRAGCPRYQFLCACSSLIDLPEAAAAEVAVATSLDVATSLVADVVEVEDEDDDDFSWWE